MVSGETSGEPRRARDTVETETPARLATSAMLDGGSVSDVIDLTRVDGRDPLA